MRPAWKTRIKNTCPLLPLLSSPPALRTVSNKADILTHSLNIAGLTCHVFGSCWLSIYSMCVWYSTRCEGCSLLSVTKSCPTLHDPMDCSMPGFSVHHQLPCPTPTCSNSGPLSRWCHTTISSSAVPFSSCLLSFPASGSFPMSQFFASGGQSIGASASASILPKSIQGWFSLRLTGLISLLSKGLSRVFSSTTIRKHQFFGTLSSLLSSSHIHTWQLERP